ncbi:chloramphenicol-sensitive protein RarD [Sinobacterium caligoides]|uniref:Chloramphenicol-sensitive protein RarD n=1 Tax=Sinobacterium caligoides TaxID=933926 RepID=A0A3N2DZR8_9GAMM|nr:EamA family transporter RarD [Sinobacterium caligoides]ROS05328.1 chloramphenicol-sensitive protein RarD [Sinobacterium caligoides]
MSTALLRALGAYLLWGIFPLYFVLLADVAPLEVLAHRVLWASVLLLAVMAVLGQLSQLKQLCKNKGLLLWLSLAAVMLSINWGTYIYSISTNQALEASLGYFINPLVNIVLAMLFLGERLSRAQWIAIALAATGIVLQLWQLGSLPLISIALAFSWGIYGLIKKKVKLPALAALTAETLVMLPLAIAYLCYLQSQGQLAFSRELHYTWLLPLSGIVTALPLFLFGAAAKQLSFITLSFLQYMTPTMVFFIAIFVFAEPLSVTKLWTFGFIWLGLAIFSLDSLRQHRRRAKGV